MTVSRPPSVAFVLGLPYPQTVGGAERWVAEAARALAPKADLSVHYMAGEGARPSGSSCRLHGYRSPPLREADRLALSPSLVRCAARADVVHVFHFGALMPQLLALRGRLGRQPVFVTDLGANGVALGRRLGLHNLFSGFLEISRFATAGRPAARTRVVWGGVDVDRHRPGAKDPEPFALFVGRLLPHKGIDVLIDALPAGRRLVVAGRPDLERHAGYLRLLHERAAGKDVRFVVDAGDAELARLYAAATVTVLPSLWVDVYGHRHHVPELLGLTLLESLASGTPVIATDVASLPEIVRDGDTGCVVAPGDVRALAEALESYLRDPDAAALAGVRGRADVLARFTWDEVAQRCLDAYRELG
jgi:glycosyltransferase involved in cell wall biosynthesis